MTIETFGLTYNPYALRTELVTDPLGLGYADRLAVSDYIGVASILNQMGSGAAFTIWRNDIQPKEIVNAIQPADFIKMTTQQCQMLQVLFVDVPIDATMSGVRSKFSIVFSGATATVAALAALASRQASRAEVLFGNGLAITDLQVDQAWAIASGLSG